MNNTIKSLNNKLADYLDQEIAIKQELQVAWNKVFDDMSVLRDAITKVESSDEFTWVQGGDQIASWIRFDLSSFSDCIDYLEEYLNERGIQLDKQNDCLYYSQGGCFVISEDGDVYDTDSRKFFIDHDDYRDEESGDLNDGKRNELIEAHMEKTGYFPGVFRTDRHGNVFPVSTKA